MATRSCLSSQFGERRYDSGSYDRRYLVRVNLAAQLYGNAVHPTGGSSRGVRAQISFLFPKLTKEQQMRMMEQKLKQMKAEQPQKK